jgi:hypothetical protein
LISIFDVTKLTLHWDALTVALTLLFLFLLELSSILIC